MSEQTYRPELQQYHLPPQEYHPRRFGMAAPVILSAAGAAVALWLLERQTGAVSDTARRARAAAEELWEHAGERAHSSFSNGERRLASMFRSLGGTAKGEIGRISPRKLRQAYAALAGQQYESHRGRNLLLGSLMTAGISAAAAYLLNPTSGPRHRKALRLRAESLGRQASEWASAAAVSARHFAESATESIGGRFGHREDEAHRPARGDLARRVRQRVSEILGDDMGDVRVAANSGRVTITGQLPQTVRQRILDAARAIEGVSQVEYHPHDA